MKKETIKSQLDKIKRRIYKELKDQKFENALTLVSTAAGILYESNICYVDKQLEECLKQVSKEIVKKSFFGNLSPDHIIFYDGFGLDSRGLSQIYLKALCKIGIVTYVTKSSSCDSIPTIIRIVEEGGGTCLFLKGKREIDRIEQLNDIINNINPLHFFLYAMPNDVVATTLLYAYEKEMIRYQINLTDHAFWLGAEAIDISIEFRDYGAWISKGYRGISEEKLIKIPYYPVVDPEQEFLGYPFDIDTKRQRIVFSGGALYKTLGADDQYYKIVRHILETYQDVIFWYAGAGNRKEMDKLILEYPNRVYLTPERIDLFQVLKKSYLYLNTYPIGGGLMMQYASIAQKVPLTLKYSNILDDVLLNQKQLGIEFDNLDDFYRELDHLMSDHKYAYNKGIEMNKAVISENEFEDKVKTLLEGNYKSEPMKEMIIDESKLHQEYLNNYNKIALCVAIASKRAWVVFRIFPMRFIIGVVFRGKRKLNHRLKSVRV